MPRFLSTLSLRRATSEFLIGSRSQKPFLSTLSLRRATSICKRLHSLPDYFYPRSPCGERLNAHLYYHSRGLFLSTLSLRRATANWFDLWGWAEYFYPRSPCGERQCSFGNPYKKPYFYPRSPCGERLCAFVSLFGVFLFLSTLSLRRAT